MLGTLVAPSFLGSCTSPEASKAAGIAFGKEHFKVSDSDLKQVLAAALEAGGDYADLFFEHTLHNSIQLQDGAVNNAQSNIDFGMGVRVLAGDQTGYAYVENITLDEMVRAARTAARIANNNNAKQQVADLTEVKPKGKYYDVQTPWETFTVKDKMPYLQKLNDKIFALDKRVHKVRAVLSDSTSHIFFCNSEGKMYYDYRPMCSLGAICIMEENGRVENSYVSRAYRMGTEFLTDDLIDLLAKEAVDKTAILFHAIKPKGGELPVVMGAGGSGILLHEAMGHAFEADFNRKGQSVFSGKMGQKVCDSSISIVDDGTIPANRGACNYDDEGVPGQKTYMVTDGILTSYLHDRISAAYFGVSPTGNGRRESFRYNPIPRMRATYMESGCDGSAEDLIASVRKGIYVDQFSNGQVKIGEGDFTFYVKSGRLIENGRLTAPIKDINIIGNGPEALADIRGVASDLKIDEGTWTCGKEQSVPVSCGIPSVLIGGLTVGGE